jgi:hypothetical protein
MGYSWMAGVRFPTEARHTSLLHSFQKGSATQIPSYPMGIGKFCRGWMWPGRESDHSNTSRAEINSGGAIVPSPQGHGAKLIKHRDNFALPNSVSIKMDWNVRFASSLCRHTHAHAHAHTHTHTHTLSLSLLLRRVRAFSLLGFGFFIPVILKPDTDLQHCAELYFSWLYRNIL